MKRWIFSPWVWSCAWVKTASFSQFFMTGNLVCQKGWNHHWVTRVEQFWQFLSQAIITNNQGNHHKELARYLMVATQRFFIYTPKIGEMIPILTVAYFSWWVGSTTNLGTLWTQDINPSINGVRIQKWFWKNIWKVKNHDPRCWIATWKCEILYKGPGMWTGKTGQLQRRRAERQKTAKSPHPKSKA